MSRSLAPAVAPGGSVRPRPSDRAGGPTMAAMQQVFRVTGGRRLEGEIGVVGAKNSVLKLMAAALLARGRTTITNVPDILDVAIMAELLRRLGLHGGARLDPPRRSGGTVTIDVPDVPHHQADYDLVRRMRASICVLGPLIARCGAADVALPGGDAIGSRGLDMHMAGLQRLGATFDSEHGFLVAKANELHGGQIWLDFPSVGRHREHPDGRGAGRGRTVIDNAAREPEIVDICEMLIEMGAQIIDGAGTSTLAIEGVPELQPVEHATVPDRIVAGTWAVAAAITRRRRVHPRAPIGEHLEMALDKLASARGE